MKVSFAAILAVALLSGGVALAQSSSGSSGGSTSSGGGASRSSSAAGPSSTAPSAASPFDSSDRSLESRSVGAGSRAQCAPGAAVRGRDWPRRVRTALQCTRGPPSHLFRSIPIAQPEGEAGRVIGRHRRDRQQAESTLAASVEAPPAENRAHRIWSPTERRTTRAHHNGGTFP
jgi:hypothetical protein